MRQLSWVLLMLFLSGCSFVTTSPSPLFTETDFAFSIPDGLYSTSNGIQADLRMTGKTLQVRLTEQKDKVSNVIAGIVPTRYASFGVMQIVNFEQSRTLYVPVRVTDDGLTLLFYPKENTPAFDTVFSRHGFIPETGTWRQDAPFDQQHLLSFYTELLDLIATDPCWSGDKSLCPYSVEVFQRKTMD